MKKYKIPVFENMGNINEQIKNYKFIRIILIKYLKGYTAIKLSNFIRKGYYISNKDKSNLKQKNKILRIFIINLKKFNIT